MSATPAQPTMPKPEATHPCVRCGAPVALDTGLCERCNPLGLSDSASSQAHGTVFLGILVAVVVLAVGGRLALSGIGPFDAAVTAIQRADGGLAVTITVRNDGSAAGSSVCRLTNPDNAGLGAAAVVRTPRIEGGGSATFAATVTEFGATPRILSISCERP